MRIGLSIAAVVLGGLLVGATDADPPPVPRDLPASRPAPQDPRGAELRLMYFPPHRYRTIREIRTDGVVLLTNAPRPTDDVLRDHLLAVQRQLGMLPMGPAPASQPTSRPTTQPKPKPIIMALYGRQDEFRALWRRVGVYYKGQFFGLARAGGYSYRPFCATFVDIDHPDAPPAELAHELAHVWLWRHGGLPNDGNWLSEGIATAIGLRLRADDNARREWAAKVATGRYMPLKRLMSTSPVETTRYWQTCTLVETILTHHADSLPALIAAVAEGRSAHYIVTKVLRTNWVELAQRWKAHTAGATGPLADQCAIQTIDP